MFLRIKFIADMLKKIEILKIYIEVLQERGMLLRQSGFVQTVS